MTGRFWVNAAAGSAANAWGMVLSCWTAIMPVACGTSTLPEQQVRAGGVWDVEVGKDLAGTAVGEQYRIGQVSACQSARGGPIQLENPERRGADLQRQCEHRAGAGGDA